MATNSEQIIESILTDPELSKMFEDPVTFSRSVLDMEPRWYQKLMLTDDNNKRVVRTGRRAGKTASMIIHMLWYGFTHPDSKQLVIAPIGIQVDTIFDELRKFINGNELLRMSLKRSIQSPQRIEFGNGAIILGLSAGTSSGSGGKSIRGQGADWIYLDESDYLSNSDLNSIMGVQLEDAERIGIWSASTPTGAKAMYYEWCQNASVTHTVNNYEDLEYVKKEDPDGNGWTQFNFPSMVSPNWSDEMEQELRAMFTEIGYIHEVLAEFGDEEAGVYKNHYINKAKFNYTYEEMRKRRPSPNYKRIIGIDWDKNNAPTEIAVSEFDAKHKKIRVVDRAEIPSSEFTFDEAMVKIRELFSFWNADYIYADKGYGEYQVELLKKEIGKNIVKGVRFNQKLEVLDPIDKTMDKKELKHFMVNQTSILFEREQIMLPAKDDKLLRQFEAYKVVRYTSSGKPVYTDKDEHIHDAVGLTILGFNLEYPDKTKLLQRIQHATKMQKVKKKFAPKDENKIFNKNGFKSKEEKDEFDSEPEYVKHMKSITHYSSAKQAMRKTFTGSIRGRGRSSGRSSRSSF